LYGVLETDVLLLLDPNICGNVLGSLRGLNKKFVNRFGIIGTAICEVVPPGVSAGEGGTEVETDASSLEVDEASSSWSAIALVAACALEEIP
jgi:hypothetical protein